ncbi:nucleoside recognition domain-containing protein, partial [Schnuerera ultunensis]|uniref:nucleoside recognition domain-containing protein n=1 Tax=Schnuerera ultunensis TaxID=45497 RepID=UPI002E81818B
MAIIIGFFTILGSKMGLINAINTLLNTAYDLLMNTVFKIMAIAVIAGAVASILTEFGVISLANKLLSPLMKPLYGLPGASVISIFTTYLSDNPAVLTLAEDRRFRRYFKKYQLPALTNIGTSFGMGLIVTIFMMGLTSPSGENFILAAIIGNIGAIIGS